MSNRYESWLTYAQTMADYNQWMNQRLYDVSATLSDAQRKDDKGAFFKSIHGTFNHILLADRIWMGRFTGEPYVVPGLSHELYSDFDTLHRERVAEDARIKTWVEALQATDMGKGLYFKPMTNPQPKTVPMWLAVMHFFNHQTHHRGQITTLLSQLGLDPGVTDLPYMPSLIS